MTVTSFAADSMFTQEERQYIKDNPVIEIGVDPNFVPFEFIDTDDIYKGIANDFLLVIEERTGIKFVVRKGLSWSEAYELAVEGELDMLPSVSKTSDRDKYFLFSDPYYRFQRVIVMPENDTNVQNYRDLFGETVAVQMNSSHHSYLQDYPEIDVSAYVSVEDALEALSSGEEQYFLGNLAATNYISREMGITHLKYVSVDNGLATNLHFAVSKDNPVLLSIINKSLDSMTEEERLLIFNKWINVDYGRDYSNVFRAIGLSTFLILIIAAVSFFWNIRLRSEIRRRIETEKALKKAKSQAEEATHVKSSFIARMSHEIRTPLNAITGLSYLVLNTDLTDRQRSHMEKLRNASETMMSIINDILDISKIEAGKIELEHECFELDQVISNTMNIIAFRAEEKNLHLTLTKDPKVPNHYIGDQVRISQILLNLLNNAVKFTEQGSISLGVELFGFERDTYQLLFVISDTGIGISENSQQKLFTPFTQEDATINRRYGGTGLGLSIVKTLVELMDGDVRVASKQGEGSRFSVRLKLKVDSDKENVSRKGFEYIKDINTLILNNEMNSLSMVVSYLKSFSIDPEYTSSDLQFKELIKDKGMGKQYDLLIVYEKSVPGKIEEFVHQIMDMVNDQYPPRIIIIKDFSTVIDGSVIDEQIAVLKEPFLPSMLYNVIAGLFKFKVMASQVETSVGRATKGRALISGRILVVEDNLTNQLIAKEILSPLGLTVDQAHDGKAAIDKVADREYGLILMDLHMPIMNGFDATEEIRKNCDTPIIAMTADAIEGVKEKCLAYGMNDFISKPFVPGRFIDKVSGYFESSKEALPEETIEVQAGETIVDFDLGLKLMGGNQRLYRQVKIMFLEENKDTLEQFENHLKEGAYKKAEKLVHKVKSSAGSLGSEKVRVTAAMLQEALVAQDEATIPKAAGMFKQQFGELMIQTERSII